MIKQRSTTKLPILPISIVFVVAGIFLVYIVGVVQNGAGPIESRATRSEFLTAGDDVLSLKEDLKKLEQNPTESDEAIFE